jgi:hypothetical protein
MNYDSDDLEELLRQNLNLRLKLGAQVAKAKDGSAKLCSPKPLKPIRRPAIWSARSVQQVAAPFQSNEASTPDPFHRRDGGKPSGPSVGDFQLNSDNEPEGFRRKLRLGSLIAPAEYRGARTKRGGRSECTENTAATLSDDEGLSELRRQLRLRRGRGAERTKATRVGYNLGCALYWTFLAMAAVSAMLMLRLRGDWYLDDEALIAAGLSAFLFYGLGRDFLYALSRWGATWGGGVRPLLRRPINELHFNGLH